MIKVNVELAPSQPGGAIRPLANMEVPSAPLPREPIMIGERVFAVIQRVWKITPDGVEMGILVEQVGGPPMLGIATPADAARMGLNLG